VRADMGIGRHGYEGGKEAQPLLTLLRYLLAERSALFHRRRLSLLHPSIRKLPAASDVCADTCEHGPARIIPL
jgi:hypothetical protein